MVRASAFLFAAALAPARAYVAPRYPPQQGASKIESAQHVAERLPQVSDHIRQDDRVEKSAWNPIALGLVLGLFAAVVGGKAPSAVAADAGNGEQIFAGNCSSCHAGGNNVVSPDKKLRKEELQKYGKYEPAAIVAQITKGNGAMPAFGTKISPDDIQDVAAYVREKADKGW